MLRHGDYKVIKSYDSWGYWEYILLKDNNLFARSSSFERLKNIAYAKEEIINGIPWLYNFDKQVVDGKQRKIKVYLTSAFHNDYYGVQFTDGICFGGM